VAHQKWGAKPWAADVAPAIALARDGFEILPKTHDFFDEQVKKLHRGDAELARLYLVGGELPAVGTRLKNDDLAHTMELLAQKGRDGFYRGEVADKIVAASQRGGGVLAPADLSDYEARIVEPLVMDFRGYRLASAPPPANGASLFMPMMKALEADDFGGGPLRTAVNLDRIGRVWRIVEPQERRLIADSPAARTNFEILISPESIRAIRERATGSEPAGKSSSSLDDGPLYESAMAATTQWMIADAQGNIACCTQSLSLHFGAGVVPPGTGVVMNDSMSNFAYADSKSLNFVVPGRRPRSTIAPTIVERDGKLRFAIGVPGAARIPTALLQVLLDRLVLNRPLADAIGDTRVHYVAAVHKDEADSFEAEQSLPAGVADELRTLGWKVILPEESGRGRHFGGVNAIEFNPDGSLSGYPDPRRTNAAAGY
jgi:gamma-glutamyltranspeptidase/glutathione hydrolase